MYLSRGWLMLWMTTLLFALTDGVRILLLPLPRYSHLTMFTQTARNLVQHGHDVWILIPQHSEDLLYGTGIKPIVYYTCDKDNIDSILSGGKYCSDRQRAAMENYYITVSEALTALVARVLDDAIIMSTLTQYHFTYAIVDGTFRAAYIIPYVLTIPFSTITTSFDPWTAGVASSPSLEPHQLTSFTNHMTFAERMLNHVIHLMTYIFLPVGRSGLNRLLRQHAQHRPHKTIEDVYKMSQMWFVMSDNVCLDYQRASGPFYRFVGLPRPVNKVPMSEELKEYVSSAQHGVVVMTFGCLTSTGAIPDSLFAKFTEAFSQTKQKYVVKQSNITQIYHTSNAYFSDWLPMDALLGHPNVKLLITNGGHFSQAEAVYHGVPILSLPGIGDQFYNARRVDARGFGRTLDPFTMTSNDLSSAIKDLIDNSSYKDTLSPCSKLHRKMVPPGETIAFWIDHILEFGVAHFGAPVEAVSVFRVVALDVILALALTVALLAAFCWKVLIFASGLWRKAKTAHPTFPALAFGTFIALFLVSTLHAAFFEPQTLDL